LPQTGRLLGLARQNIPKETTKHLSHGTLIQKVSNAKQTRSELAVD